MVTTSEAVGVQRQ